MGMRTTGIFETHRYGISGMGIGRPVTIVPFGDVHFDSPLFSKSEWERFLQWAKEQRDTYFLGMGDYQDCRSSKGRAAMKAANLGRHWQEISREEKLMQQDTDSFYRDISFMEGKLIGLHEGNHYFEYQDGTTSTQRLCSKLGCKYLGVEAFTRISLEASGNVRAKVDIWSHHGAGAARLSGGSMNRVQYQAETAEADIFLMGHDHRRGVTMSSRLFLDSDGKSPNGLRVVERRQVYGRTGTFLRSRMPGMVSYVSDAAMNATDLGVIKIKLTMRRSQHGPLVVDIEAGL